MSKASNTSTSPISNPALPPLKNAPIVEVERPVDLDEPVVEKREDDYMRLTCRALSQHANAKDQAELPATVRIMYQGKTIELEVGGKGKVMTRGCANHIVRKASTWSFKADLLLEDVK